MTYIVLSGALNSTPTNPTSIAAAIDRRDRQTDIVPLRGLDAQHRQRTASAVSIRKYTQNAVSSEKMCKSAKKNRTLQRNFGENVDSAARRDARISGIPV